MTTQTNCCGCGNWFSSAVYYGSHLAQTKNPLCKAVLHEQFAAYSDEDEDSSMPEDDPTPQVIPFGGNIFGIASDYQNDDFGQLDNNEDEDDTQGRNEDEDAAQRQNKDDEEEDMEQRKMNETLEAAWERPRPIPEDDGSLGMGTDVDEDEEGFAFDAAARASVEARFDACTSHIVRYSSLHPRSNVGAVVSTGQHVDGSYSSSLGSNSNPWAPFKSEIDWKFERWGKLRGPGSTALSELLAINGLVEALGLSYKNTDELNKVIDNSLPHRPAFKRQEFVVAGESFELFARDIVKCLKALWGNPEFLPYLVFEAEHHYANGDQTIRLFHDMHTGRWWWDTQRRVERKTKKSGITIVPIILSSDKTQLTPSRQGQILLAYLPTSKLKHITNKSACRRAVANLFHACMGFLLKPLEILGETGLLMRSGDGAVHDCHPILAAYCGDYPEQTLVTCTTHCPTCPVPRNELGNPKSVGAARKLKPILEALDTITEGPTEYTRSWLKKACGEAKIDARCRRLPPNHNTRLFLKGISHLGRVTGTEHDQICRFILGLIIDIKIPNARRGTTACLVRAVCGMLDFLYLAKYPMYHENHQVFINFGIRQNFNFPKDHFSNHYRELIKLFGTTNNFNTKYTEHLHIDLAKEAFRATNSKDEFPQMTAWLDRREKVMLHEKFILRRFEDSSNNVPPPRIPPLVQPREMKMATSPLVYGVSFEEIETKYGATDFKGALSRFVIHSQRPELTKRQVEDAAASLHLPFYKVSVFHRIKFISHDPYSINPSASIVVDSIHCEPTRFNRYNNRIPGRFDTAMVNIANGGRVGVKGYCVGQIHCVFVLPSKVQKEWFPGQSPPSHLAYVEWFTPFASLRPGRDHGLYKISKRTTDGQQRASVIPINLIKQSAHLIPAFGPIAPAEWKSSTVLEVASSLYVNCFSDRFPYSTIY
ncbi:hypothetical protein CPB83DRAFT_872088 [Crepidotus variabilis]|uniref:Uncharacterized protein n=1 Tax=Crepidotus variabilis TaxID=179855 RepID=A0A9P6E474_9AGAR|nr:hypothetical protein CPB83DRAFT_872088 [Crepidotus variabilis]